MKATIDAAGRIVVPKALRDAMGVKAGQTLHLEVHDGRLEVEVSATAMRLRGRGRRVVAVPDVDLPPLAASQVRATLEQTRR